MTFKRITSPHICLIGGVLAGLSYQFKRPVSWFRWGFILFGLLFLPAALIFYCAAWMLLPKLIINKKDFNTLTQRPLFNKGKKAIPIMVLQAVRIYK